MSDERPPRPKRTGPSAGGARRNAGGAKGGSKGGPRPPGSRGPAGSRGSSGAAAGSGRSVGVAAGGKSGTGPGFAARRSAGPRSRCGGGRSRRPAGFRFRRRRRRYRAGRGSSTGPGTRRVPLGVLAPAGLVARGASSIRQGSTIRAVEPAHGRGEAPTAADRAGQSVRVARRARDRPARAPSIVDARVVRHQFAPPDRRPYAGPVGPVRPAAADRQATRPRGSDRRDRPQASATTGVRRTRIAVQVPAAQGRRGDRGPASTGRLAEVPGAAVRTGPLDCPRPAMEQPGPDMDLRVRPPPRSGWARMKRSSPVGGRSRRRSSPGVAPCGCSSSRSAARPSSGSSSMPRTCGFRSSRSRAGH